MKLTVRLALAAVLFVLGLSCLAYPVVSNLVIGYAQARVAKENVVAASSLDDGALQAERDRAHAYNEALAQGKAYVSDPFDPDSLTIQEGEYDGILNLSGNGVMATVRVDSAGVYVPIYHGTDDNALQQGAGHLVGTSLPIGGEGTHCVIAGHTGLPSVKVFDNLTKVGVGDYVTLETLGETLCYQVYDIEVVEPEDTSSLAMEEGRDLLTLVTCTPYGINSHRLLVHAQRCDVPMEEAQAETDVDGMSSFPWFDVVTLVLVATLSGIFVVEGSKLCSGKRKR